MFQPCVRYVLAELVAEHLAQSPRSLRRHTELLAAGVDDILFEHEWDLVVRAAALFERMPSLMNVTLVQFVPS